MMLALLFPAMLLSAESFERVAVVTVGKEGVSARVTGNAWFMLERKLGRISGLRIVDAGEQTLKLHADSGAAVDGCKQDAVCLAAIGTRLSVDRLLALRVEPTKSGGFVGKLIVVDVAGRRIHHETAFDVKASGDLDPRADVELKKIFATKLADAPPPLAPQLPPQATPVAPRHTVTVLPEAPIDQAPKKRKKTADTPVATLQPRAAPAPAPTPAPRQPLAVNVIAEEPRSYRPGGLGVGSIVLTVFSVAMMATAVGVGVSSQATHDQITDRTPQITANRMMADSTTRATVANVSYAVGAAGLAAGATMFAIDFWRFKNR
jgi:hypothetical protein